jgi:hypothetical protein
VNGLYPHTLNLAIQAGKLTSLFPMSMITFNQNILVWESSITPSPLSDEYRIKIIYPRDSHPDVFIVSPRLTLYPGQEKLPHVYDTEKQWLCIYYRRGREWRSNMAISDTVLPWTSEWLLHYEFWLGTGNWLGGGLHSDIISPNEY